MFSKYIIFSDLSDWHLHTFFAENQEGLEAILKTCVYNWVHNPETTWEGGVQPKPKKLFKECMADKDFGDIATIIEYDEMTRSYFEWGDK